MTDQGYILFHFFEVLDQSFSYLHRSDGTNVSVNRGKISADRHLNIRFDGYFDIFFESYWTKFTPLKSVAIGFYLDGQATIKILRRSAKTGDEDIIFHHHYAVDGGQYISCPVSLTSQDASYLILEMELRAGSVVTDLAWRTNVEPRRQVSLAAVICTFNREKIISKNLSKLSENNPFDEIFVINQGDLSDDFRYKFGNYINIIDQENFGGSGGFTRGVIECVYKNYDLNISHIIFMDDDININYDLINRIKSVIYYAEEKICIGASMLELENPYHLFSCGDLIDESSPSIHNIGGVDISKDDGRDFASKIHYPDFSGWWCFAFPVAAVHAEGLPLPLFIRGDDVEFGVRLKNAGYPTLSWPGAAVWHMAFAGKRQAWHIFYDRRNSLFLCEAHRAISKGRLLKLGWASFATHLLKYDYARAYMVPAAFAAFNSGVTTLERWTSDNHYALQGYDRPIDHPVRHRQKLYFPEPVVKRARAFLIGRRLIYDMVWPFRLRPAAYRVQASHWNGYSKARPADVLLVEDSDGSERLYRYEWCRALPLIGAMAMQSLRFLIFRRFRRNSLMRLTTPG